MNMEQRISLVTLGVKDLERSRGFYERLGWRRSMPKAEGVLFLQSDPDGFLWEVAWNPHFALNAQGQVVLP